MFAPERSVLRINIEKPSFLRALLFHETTFGEKSQIVFAAEGGQLAFPGGVIRVTATIG
jgi:hypothetical protein